MDFQGSFYSIQNVTLPYDDLQTKVAIQKNIDKSQYIPPGGHVSILKSGYGETEHEHVVIFTGGTEFTQGKQHTFSEDLFSIKIESKKD